MDIVQPNKIYHTDHNIVYGCQYHVIWCPKYRRRVLTDEVVPRLQELILEKQEEYGYTVIEMEVMPDQVHLLIDADPRIGIVRIVGRIKGYTSNRLRNEIPWLKKRLPTLWTRSKFIATVGAVSLDAVQKYIADQKNV